MVAGLCPRRRRDLDEDALLKRRVDKAFYVQQSGYYRLTADLNTLTVTLERLGDWQE